MSSIIHVVACIDTPFLSMAECFHAWIWHILFTIHPWTDIWDWVSLLVIMSSTGKNILVLLIPVYSSFVYIFRSTIAGSYDNSGVMRNQLNIFELSYTSSNWQTRAEPRQSGFRPLAVNYYIIAYKLLVLWTILLKHSSIQVWAWKNSCEYILLGNNSQLQFS